MTTLAEQVGLLATQVAELVDITTDKLTYFDGKIAEAEAKVEEVADAGDAKLAAIADAGDAELAEVAAAGAPIIAAAQGARDTAAAHLAAINALAPTIAANATAAQQGAANATAISQSSLAGVAKSVSASASVVASAPFSCATMDTDGGANREKVAHVSYVNETLNTATRGPRAVRPQNFRIEATATLLSVFDLDDPATLLWKSWTVAGLTSAVYLGNGQIAYAGTGGAYVIDMIADTVDRLDTGGRWRSNQSVAAYNQGTSTWSLIASGGIPNNTVNSIAGFVVTMTPLNPARCGLPNVQIGLGTAGGGSIIRWDGVVCNSSNVFAISNVAFMPDGVLLSRTVGTAYLVSPAIYQTPSWSHFGAAVGATGSSLLLRFSQAPAVNMTVAAAAGRRVIAGNNAGGGMFNVLPDQVNLANSLASYKTNLFDTGVLLPGCVFAAAESSAELSNLSGTPVVNEQWAYADQAAAVAAGWVAPVQGGALSFPSAGVMRITSNGSLDATYKQFTVSLLKWYEVEVTVAAAAGQAQVMVENTVSGGQYVTSAILGPGTYRFQFPASSTNLIVQLRSRTPGSTVDYGTVTVREVAADRRGLGNTANGFVSMRPVGTVPRTIVATGAELADLGPFTAGDYLLGPYNAALDHGTNDFYAGPFWPVDDGVSSVQVLAERAHYTGGAYSGARWQIIKDTNRWQFVVSDGTNSVTVNGPTFTPTANRRYQVAGGKRGSVFYLMVDGVIVATAAVGSVGSLSNASAVLTVGRRHPDNTTASVYGGKIASIFQFGQATILPDMFRAKYEIERNYFREGAKILMLGSASVNSLAYDAETDTIYAATPAGTLAFNASTGLRTGYLQSTLAANKINAEATVTSQQATVVKSNIGGPTGWGVDRYSWSLTEDASNAVHRAMFPLVALTAQTHVLAIPLKAGSRGWAAVALSAGGGFYFNLATGASGNTYFGDAISTALPSVNLGDGWWLVQFSFTATATNWRPDVYSATGNGTGSFVGNNGVGGPALYFGKPVLMQRSTALTAADYQYALSNSDNHAIVSANDNIIAIRSAAGVDLFMPAIGQRERATARRGVVPYDPNVGEHAAMFTTDATPTRAFVIPIREGESYGFECHLPMVQHGGTATERAFYRVSGMVRRDVGGSPTVVIAESVAMDETTAGMDVTATTGLGSDAWGLSFAGKAATRMGGAPRLRLFRTPLAQAA